LLADEYGCCRDAREVLIQPTPRHVHDNALNLTDGEFEKARSFTLQ